MAQLIMRKERGIIFEGSRKNYPAVDLPKWMRKHQELAEIEAEQKF
jgi:hypothetical protein